MDWKDGVGSASGFFLILFGAGFLSQWANNPLNGNSLIGAAGAFMVTAGVGLISYILSD